MAASASSPFIAVDFGSRQVFELRLDDPSKIFVVIDYENACLSCALRIWPAGSPKTSFPVGITVSLKVPPIRGYLVSDGQSQASAMSLVVKNRSTAGPHVPERLHCHHRLPCRDFSMYRSCCG